MDTKITFNDIFDWFNKKVSNKEPVPPLEWLEGAQRLNVLLGEEQSIYWDRAQEVANLRKLRIEDGDSVSKAKIYIEATDEYRDLQKQKARIERGVELIRIAKQMSRTADDERKGY